MQLPAFSNAYQRVINKKVILSNDFAARTALEDQYGFTIIEGKDVKVITDVDGSVYYNMLIERAAKENLKFENLIIKVKDGDVGAVILKYELNQKATYFQEHDSYDFDIKETIMLPLEIEGNSSELRNTVTIVTIFSHCTKPFGDPKYCGGNYSSPFWSPACSHLEYNTVVLDSNNSGGTGGGWTPNTNNGPITPGGGFGNSGSTVITAPIVDDENVLASNFIANLDLSPEENAWLNNHFSIKLNVIDYLVINHTQADYDFVNDMIDLCLENGGTFVINNNVTSENSIAVNSLEEFQSFLNALPSVGNEEEYQIVGTQKTASTKVWFSFPTGGTKFFVKQTILPIYNIEDVTSNAFGVTLVFSWNQTTYDVSINQTTNIATVNIYGVFKL